MSSRSQYYPKLIIAESQVKPLSNAPVEPLVKAQAETETERKVEKEEEI